VRSTLCEELPSDVLATEGPGGERGVWEGGGQRTRHGPKRSGDGTQVRCAAQVEVMGGGRADNRARERRIAKLTQCAGNSPRRGESTSSRCTLSKWSTTASEIGCGGTGGRAQGLVVAGEKSQTCTPCGNGAVKGGWASSKRKGIPHLPYASGSVLPLRCACTTSARACTQKVRSVPLCEGTLSVSRNGARAWSPHC
jgi:hypothetical protein